MYAHTHTHAHAHTHAHIRTHKHTHTYTHLVTTFQLLNEGHHFLSSQSIHHITANLVSSKCTEYWSLASNKLEKGPLSKLTKLLCTKVVSDASFNS